MIDIYTITCLYDLPPFCYGFLTNEERQIKNKEFSSHGGIRIFGWFDELGKAISSVENNECDLHECSYKYAIIEKYQKEFMGHLLVVMKSIGMNGKMESI